jgi:hypothetical protein
MAKKSMDLEVVETIRKTWIAKFDTVIEKNLKKLWDRSKELHDNASKYVTDFSQSENVSYLVGAKVIECINEGKQRQALITVHKAINACQELSSIFRLVLYPSILDINNDIIFMYNRTLNSFKADIDVATNYTSNAEIEREASFVCIMAERIVDSTVLNKEKIEQYLKFVDEQMYSLSRLDNMLRTNEKMLFSESFSRGSSNYMMNNPVEDDEEDCDVEIKFVPERKHANSYVAVKDGDAIKMSDSRKLLKNSLSVDQLRHAIELYYVEDDLDCVLLEVYDTEEQRWEKQ